MLTPCDEDREKKSLQQILALADLLNRKRVRNICIEAGHIYMDETPNDQHHLSLKIGVMFAEVIGKIIPTITKMLFVDDYNPSSSNLHLPDYLQTARTIGFHPDVIVWELSLTENAHNFVEELKKADATTISPDGHIHTRHQNIRLRYKNGRLACSLLDTTLYIKRFKEYDFNLTILPGEFECEYRKQQKNVRRLLRLAGIENLPMANVFFYQDGSFSISKP